MISVETALERIRAGFGPLPAETVGLGEALGRVLAEDLNARRTQPPFAVSAMDGWAVRSADAATLPVTLTRIGAVPAGGRFQRWVGPGETVRIFTGAPLPDGADAVILQEDADLAGDEVTFREAARPGRHVRPEGIDFAEGQTLLSAGTRLGARQIALAAAMNRPWLQVHRRPIVAILATGDELALPGEPIGPNQIVASNGLALAALIAAVGGVPIDLGIAPDEAEAIAARAAGARGADLLITIGGASVGDHDLVQPALARLGLKVDFWKIAMRPGKPLMFGRLGAVPVLGLPGNPVSALVCGMLFALPALQVLQGLPGTGLIAEPARLATPLDANGARQDYVRANLTREPDGWRATPLPRQDSSVLSTLAGADGLILRPPDAPASGVGDIVSVLPFPPGF